MGAAARAFQRGQHAQLHHEYGRAAAMFELADAAAPSAGALRSAIRNWDAAGNAARAATLAQQAIGRYPHDLETIRLATALLTRRTRSLGSLRAHCAPACSLVVDGHSTSSGPLVDHDLYLAPGDHAVVTEYEDGRSARQHLHLGAGEHRDLSLLAPTEVAHRRAPTTTTPRATGAAASDDDDSDMQSIDDSAWSGPATTAARSAPATAALAPAAGPPAPLAPVDLALTRRPESVKRDRRLPPVVAVVGIGLTLGLGAVLVWSYTDTLSANDRYVAHPTVANYHDGLGRESRTFGLLGGVAALGVTTLAVALFGINWHTGFAGGDGGTRVARRLTPTMSVSGSAWLAGVSAALD